ncbi:transcription factor [Ganoderma sinense ZZ0214-1]|uniref:Transcription factor n=1 Tax=Ganoderma sinense ZZ0214-1 TaxID=1077348 RepID=A0A2G8SRH0_9APHY|nr:transcription factor [Ganoderma sinense ZZ0214-1]
MMPLPTYVLSADQCPPDDDRRHGCGICHRRFNRPSSLMIHMNSHTGAQPFKCPFPGCSRRFSVNSNMRRHYRNHREGAPMTAQAHPYPTPPPSISASSLSSRGAEPYHSASSATPSPLSSPAHTDDGHFDGPASTEPSAYVYLSARARSRSTVLPSSPVRARDRDIDQDRPPARPRACTVPGCHCEVEAPGALRPAFPFSFQPGHEREREWDPSARSSSRRHR